MHQSRWEIVGNGLVLVSLAGYAISLTARVVAGDLTTAESSVITQLLVVVGLALGFGFQQIGLWQARREARRERDQDKIERAEQAQQMTDYLKAQADVVKAQADVTALTAKLAHAETLAHIARVDDAAKAAYDVGNHSNEKIARLAEHIDSSLRIVPSVAAAVADALKPSLNPTPTMERTPGTVLTETPLPSDGHAEFKE